MAHQIGYVALPGVVLAYILILLLPIEMSFYLGPLLITPTRLFLVLAAFPLVGMLFRNEKLRIIDWMMIGYVLWVMLAYLVKRGGSGIEAAGQSFLEVAVSYLVARVFFKTPQQVVRLLLIVGVLIAILGLLAIPEAISHQRYLHNIPRMVTGIIYDMQADIRLGLLRAASTFENPILFGLFSATFLSLVWYSTLSLGARVALVAGIALSTFLSLSSAAILLLVMQIFLIMAEHALSLIHI